MSLVGFSAKNHPQQVGKRGACDDTDVVQNSGGAGASDQREGTPRMSAVFPRPVWSPEYRKLACPHCGLPICDGTWKMAVEESMDYFVCGGCDKRIYRAALSGDPRKAPNE